jgi:hypothetical protein
MSPVTHRVRPFAFVAALALVAAHGQAQTSNLNCRDGKDAPPRLQIVQNLWGLRAHPSAADEWPEEKKLREIKAAGFDAFDVWVGGAKEEDLVRWKGLAERHGLGIGVEFGPERVEDIGAGIAAAKRLGSVYLDAHVASYFTPEPEAEALLRGLVERSRRADMPLVIQTHRGRVTQDLLRTVAYAKAIPELRFDLDFSHYLVAGEHTGALPAAAEAALALLMERAAMLDGRVSNGEQVQVDLLNPAYREHLDRVAALWKRVLVGWLRGAQRGDVFPFRVELGPPGYAILGADGREISDRWAQQKAIRDLVERLWNEAVAETGTGEPHGHAERGGFPRELVDWVPYEGNPLFAGTGRGTWDDRIRERGFILRGGGLWRLLNNCYNVARGASMALGYATSPDGLRFTRHAGNPVFDGVWTEDVFVVANAGGGYQMFAEGLHDVAHRLTSKDGVSWREQGSLDLRTRSGAPLPPGPYGTPTVVVAGGTWHLFYEREDKGVWLATSKDQRVFTNVSDEPVIPLGPDAYDRHAIALNQVVRYKDRYYGVYHANADPEWKAPWTTCLAVSDDMLRWQKYPGNPVIRSDDSSGILVDDGERLRLYTMHPEVKLWLPRDSPLGRAERRAVASTLSKAVGRNGP